MALFAFDACFKMNLKLSLRRIGKVEIFSGIKGRYAALKKALHLMLQQTLFSSIFTNFNWKAFKTFFWKDYHKLFFLSKAFYKLSGISMNFQKIATSFSQILNFSKVSW